MKYINITKCDIANGDGVRVVLWISGCRVGCKGCHNKVTWDFNSGHEFTDETLNDICESLNKPYIKGITFSGGHPLEPENIGCVERIIDSVRARCPGKDIWLYTGYTLSMDSFTSIHSDDSIGRVVKKCDVVVDGPYVEDLRNISLKFRGSSNQRVIDVKRTIESNRIEVLYGGR